MILYYIIYINIYAFSRRFYPKRLTDKKMYNLNALYVLHYKNQNTKGRKVCVCRLQLQLVKLDKQDASSQRTRWEIF